MTESELVNMERTRYGVFYETETIGTGGVPVWTRLFFGFEDLRHAHRCFEMLLVATNHEKRRARGFRDLHVAAKKNGVWHEIRR